MSNGDDLRHLRTSSDEFHKWTAGISIFFITVSLTVLTFQEGDPALHNLITLGATLFFLLPNVFLTWWGLKIYLRVRALQFEINLNIFNVTDTEAKKTEFEEKNKRANKIHKWITVTFMLGFLSFIAFLITYIDC